MPLPFSENYEKTFFMNTVITYMIRVTKTELKRNKTYGDFLQRHDNEIRVGKLVRVSENLQGQTKEHHKNYNRMFCQVTRSFTCWIKDDKTTMLFSVNLNNVEIDESVLNKIIEFYSLTQSWIDKRIYVMSNIGKDNCRQYVEKDFENGILDINHIGVNPYRLSLEEIQRLSKDEFEKKFKKIYQEYKIKYHVDKNHVKNNDGKAVRNKARKRSNRLKKQQLKELERADWIPYVEWRSNKRKEIRIQKLIEEGIVTQEQLDNNEVNLDETRKIGYYWKVVWSDGREKMIRGVTKKDLIENQEKDVEGNKNDTQK